MKYTTATALLFLGSQPVEAQPTSGSLISDDDNLLKYVCSEGADGLLTCSFTQIWFSSNLSTEEVELEVDKFLKEFASETDWNEFQNHCATILPMFEAFGALADGDEEAYARFVEQNESAFDAETARAQIEGVHPRELADLRRTIASLRGVCSPGVDEAAIRELAELQAELMSRTCSVLVDSWESNFAPVSDLVWTRSERDTPGICGIVRLDRFVCDEEYPTLCNYISEQRIMNPDGEGFFRCSELDERPVHYRWRTDNIYLNCDILEY